MLREIYTTLQSFTDILFTVLIESCCEEVKNEHMKILLSEFFTEDLKGQVNDFNFEEFEKRPKYGVEYLRKLVLKDDDLSSDEKLGLLRKI